MWGCPAQAPQWVVQVGAPWLPPAFPDPAEGVPPTEALGPFYSPLSRGTISTTVRTRERQTWLRHPVAPTRALTFSPLGPSLPGLPLVPGSPLRPCREWVCGWGPDGGPQEDSHSTLAMRTLALGSGGPSRGLQPRSSFSARSLVPAEDLGKEGGLLSAVRPGCVPVD